MYLAVPASLIYIPVWLDQKRKMPYLSIAFTLDLHSSMVRLETKSSYLTVIKYANIYIPVWLDQKRTILEAVKIKDINLHSSMVRLETLYNHTYNLVNNEFTFQYGQIRNL